MSDLRMGDKVRLSELLDQTGYLLSAGQRGVIAEIGKGEEGSFALAAMENISSIAMSMPKMGETDGKGNEAKAKLHYFDGSSDWYIFELDSADEDGERQAFGYVCLNEEWQMAELGYVLLSDLMKYDCQLDLHWKDLSLDDIKLRHEPSPDMGMQHPI